MTIDWTVYAGHSAKACTALMKIGKQLGEEISKLSGRKDFADAVLEREDAEARKLGCEKKLPQTCCKLYGLTKIGLGACERLPLGDAKRLFPLVSGTIKLGLAKRVLKRFASADEARAAVKVLLAKAVSRELTGDALAEAVAELCGAKQKTKRTFWERAAALLTNEETGEDAAKEMFAELAKVIGHGNAADYLQGVADMASQACQAAESVPAMAAA